MADSKKNINPGGINGSGLGLVNINSEDYQFLQQTIKTHSQSLSFEKRLKHKLLSLRFQMEEYLSDQDSDQIIPVGYFLKEFLAALEIKNKTFANYIEYKESNLSAILNGRRKLNVDLAYKFGQIFNLDPNIWLQIQSKNELKRISLEQISDYTEYSLEELLKKAS